MRLRTRLAVGLAAGSTVAAGLTVAPPVTPAAVALGPDDSWVDVYAINRDDNGQVAIHVTDGSRNYSDYTLQTRTPLNSSPVWQFAMGDFEGDGVSDLYAINPDDNGRTAVHVLSGASNFQTFVAHYLTPLHATTDPVWEHRVADYNADGRSDVFVINRNDNGRTAVHVLDAASGFQNFTAHELTALEATTSSVWELFAADFNGDRRADLYAVNKNDNGKTAVHVLDGGGRFQTFVAHQISALPATTDWVWSLGVGDREGDGKADLYAFNRSDIASSNTRTSIHVASAEAMFEALSLQTVSAIGVTTHPNWELHLSTGRGGSGGSEDYPDALRSRVLDIVNNSYGTTETEVRNEVSEAAAYTGTTRLTAADAMLSRVARVATYDLDSVWESAAEAAACTRDVGDMVSSAFMVAYYCNSARNDAKKANSTAKRLFSRESQIKGKGDAFRHCYWNALMTVHSGKAIAKTIADNHEALNTDGGPEQERMDLANNQAGRQIGDASIADERNTKAACKWNARNGVLVTIP